MKLPGLKSAPMLARLSERPAVRPSSDVRVSNVTRQTCLAEHMQLAGNGRDRRKGLLGRPSFEPGQGLWIVPCEAVHTFWMRFTIDLVYLDRKHRVVKTCSQVRPWRMSACFAAHSVIELPAGRVRETQTMRGDMLAFDPDK